MSESKLTAKQRQFCEEYLIDRNATAAAIRAGYRSTSAKETAYENLTKPHVRTYLDLLIAQQAERTKITGDQVISELAAIASFRLTDVIELSNGKLTIKETHV
jgi:phage terminase small subunit